ncbi:MAG: hypothetical protein AAB263_17905 [Planctomycetota bacterium]
MFYAPSSRSVQATSYVRAASIRCAACNPADQEIGVPGSAITQRHWRQSPGNADLLIGWGNGMDGDRVALLETKKQTTLLCWIFNYCTSGANFFNESSILNGNNFTLTAAVRRFPFSSLNAMVARLK